MIMKKPHVVVKFSRFPSPIGSGIKDAMLTNWQHENGLSTFWNILE